MTPATVNLLLTLFVATFTVTAVLWLILALSGQASVNVGTESDKEPANDA